MNDVFIRSLEKGALYFKLPKDRWGTQLKELSWLGIVTKINADSDRINRGIDPITGEVDKSEANYAVSGEEGNVFTPGKYSYENLKASRHRYQIDSNVG